MSVSFPDSINKEAFRKLQKAFGDAAAHDDKTFLYNEMPQIDRKVMSDIARTAKQPATVELHGEGEIKVMSDGTRYQATPQGWKRLDA